MQILAIIQSNIWATIQSVVLLDLETTKKLIPDIYEKIQNGTPEKNYSNQILVAVEIYKNNIEVLVHG